MAADIQGLATRFRFFRTVLSVVLSELPLIQVFLSFPLNRAGEIASVYGRGQSMLFGSARGLQCAIYNKTKEAIVRDKLDFWQHLWAKSGGDTPFTSAYNPKSFEVWRIEVAFSINQFYLREYAAGTLDKSLVAYELAKHKNW